MFRSTSLRGPFALVFSTALVAILNATAAAATIQVTTTVDGVADGQCSIREAIEAANLDASVDGCAPEDEGYALIWEDEFDGAFLNFGNWEFMEGNGQEFGIPGWGNNELQFYTGRPSNLWVQDGTLRITAQRENYQGYQYTSARIRSKD